MSTRFPIFIVDASSYFNQKYSKKALDSHAIFYEFYLLFSHLNNTFNLTHMVVVWNKTTNHLPSAYQHEKKMTLDFMNTLKIEQIEDHNTCALDIIYTLTKDFNKQHHNVIIVSNNKKLYPLINQATTILNPHAVDKSNEMLDQETIQAIYPFPVHKIPFFLALTGDKNNSIAKIQSLTKKNGMSLVQMYQNVDDLYTHRDQLENRSLQKILEQEKSNIYKNVHRLTLRTCKIHCSISHTKIDEKNWEQVIRFLKEHGYKNVQSNHFIQEKNKNSCIKYLQTAHSCHFNVITINDYHDLKEVVQSCSRSLLCSISLQTTHSNPLMSQCSDLILAPDETTVYHIPFNQKSMINGLTVPMIKEELTLILQSLTIKKIFKQAHNYLLILNNIHLACKGPIFEIEMATSFIIENFEEKKMHEFENLYTQQAQTTYYKYKKKYQPISKETWNYIIQSHESVILYKKLQEKLIEHNCLEHFESINMPITKILADMQITGIACNIEKIQHLEKLITAQQHTIYQKIVEYTKKPINLNSKSELKHLLFSTLQLPYQAQKKNHKRLQINQQLLTKLSYLHDVPGLVLQYRHLHKLCHTFIKDILNNINITTQRVHPTWRQSLHATERICCSHPNLQNIPLNTHIGNNSIRLAFQAPLHTYFLLAAYENITLDILAHLSKDQMLLEELMHKKNIHRQTAAHIFNISEEQVSAEQLAIAQKINFSIAYGITPYGLAQDQHISYYQAQYAIKNFFATFPTLYAWLKKTIKTVTEQGYACTLFNRKRTIPGLKSKHRFLYDTSIRIALTTIIQGSAAEIVKIAMIDIAKRLIEHELNSKIILHLHDQIILEVPEHELSVVQEITKAACSKAALKQNMQLNINILIGTNWQEVSL